MTKLDPRNTFILFLLFMSAVLAVMIGHYLLRERRRFNEFGPRDIAREMVEGNENAAAAAKDEIERQTVAVDLDRTETVAYLEEKKAIVKWQTEPGYEPGPQDFRKVGDFYRKYMQIPDAANAYNLGLQKFPETVALRIGLADSALLMQAWEPALAEADEALKMEPANVEALALKSVALARLGKFREAAAAIASLETQAPNDYRTVRARLTLLIETEQYDAAIAVADEFVRINGYQQEIMNEQIRAFEKQGDFDRARATAVKAVAFNNKNDFRPKNILLFVKLALLEARRNNLVDALKNLDEAIALNPKCYLPYEVLGYVRVMRGEMRLARAAFGKSLKLFPGNRALARHIREFEKNVSETDRAMQEHIRTILQKDGKTVPPQAPDGGAR